MVEKDLVHIFVGSSKVFKVLMSHFKNKQHPARFIQSNEKTGEIVIENERHKTLDELINLSEFYPSTYVMTEIYSKYTHKIDRRKYIIFNGVCNKILADYYYIPSYLRDNL